MTKRRKWTQKQIEAEGVITSMATLGSILGCSETSAREAHRAGTLPEPVVVLRVGRRLVVPTAGILAALGLADSASDDRHVPGDQQPPAAGETPVQAMPAPGGP
jgi:hypothetical protein